MNNAISLRKSLILKLIIILVFPTQLFSQDLTGLWTGKIYTTDKTLPYEVAISEKNGQLSGYSYTTFTVKGEEMVAVKSIVVRKEKDKIIIEDEDLVFNSFDEESPKQLKQTNTMELTTNGSSMLLSGQFKTLKTKQFRSLSGGVRLKKDSIIEQPRLIAKLEEMDLSKSLSFVKPKPVPNDIAKVEKVVISAVKTPEPVKEITVETAKVSAPAVKPAAVPIKSPAPPAEVAKPVVPVKPQPVAVAPPVKKPAPPVVVASKPAVVAPKPVAVVAKPPVPVAVAVVAPPAAPPAPPVVKKESAPVRAFTSSLNNRTIETIQTVLYKSDSLTLTLYDNGEVDGDTVSVILNGVTILSKQRLSTNAITKTIYMTPEMGDSVQLIMYAENLGSIPPNTGLLIIKDGRDRYEIRFAGDLSKNAAIILRRKGS